MKGFVFTLDSFVALTLAVFAISAMLYVSSSNAGQEQPYERLRIIAGDSMELLSEVGAERGKSLENEIALLAVTGREAEAGALVENSIEPIIPKQFGFSIEFERDGEWLPIYSRNREKVSMEASSTKIIYVSEEQLQPQQCAGKYAETRGFGPLAIRMRVWA
ncbi:MAG: hypothetical protein ABIF01_01140 [Candidatus Micrarchaeota archaeon]